jgi:DNA-binding NtrC family response regulator
VALAQGSVSPPSGVAASPQGVGAAGPAVSLDVPYHAQREALLEAFESAYLRGMLDKHEGNFSRAAAAAGLDRMHFKRLLKKYER